MSLILGGGARVALVCLAMVPGVPEAQGTRWQLRETLRIGGGAGVVLGDGLELVVGWHDADERVGPVRDDQDRTDNPAPVLGRPRGQQAEGSGNDRQRCLHCIAGGVARFPLLEQVPVVQPEARGMLREIDVERCPRESGGENQRQVTGKHAALLAFLGSTANCGAVGAVRDQLALGRVSRASEFNTNPVPAGSNAAEIMMKLQAVSLVARWRAREDSNP